MKLWFAPGSAVPLYRQLYTQIVLAIASRDLQPGDKLPSTRALAQRFHIHQNTVSAAYQQLEREDWVESRRGSSVYVKDRTPPQMTPEQVLDVHIAAFFRAVRQLGLPADTVRAQVAQWLTAPPPDHFLLIEPDPAVAQILLTELRSMQRWPVKTVTPEHCRIDRLCLAGAVPLCRPSRKVIAQDAVGIGVELIVLPINSAMSWLAPLVSTAPRHLIAVISHWPEFLEIARTMLLAAGVADDALVLVDGKDATRTRGVTAVSAILCDAYTSAHAELPTSPRRFVFPLLADAARDLLHPFTDRELAQKKRSSPDGIVTPQKPS